MPPQHANSWISKIEAEDTYDRLLDRLNKTERHLETSGVRVSGSSCFGYYKRALQRLQGIAAGNQTPAISSDKQLIHDAILECELFVASIEEIARLPEVSGWRQIAAKALGGRVSSRLEKKDTPARDAQFELFLASRARQAGLMVKFEEPDIVLEMPDGKPLSIAVKRVKSASQLERRFREGAKQIKKSHLQGIVAVQLAFFEAASPTPSSLPTAMEILREETRRFALTNIGELRRQIDTTWTFGLLFFTSRLAHSGSGSWLNVAFSFYSTNICSEVDSRCSLLEAFSRNLEQSSERWLLTDRLA